MNKYIRCCFLFVTVFVMCGAGYVSAQDDFEKVEVVVNTYLKEKSKMSGTLDLYDNTHETVRNLRKIKIRKNVALGENNVYSTSIDYRDVKSGAIVTVVVNVENVDGNFKVKDIKMSEVKDLKFTEKTDYSDNEIQDVMKKYLESQSKFAGYLMLYDEENSKMRNLELVELRGAVKRLGIYFISRALCKDIESGEILEVDITVEDNKKGSLDIQGIRIREIRK